ncbi:MAG: SRPBCC family protein [Sterolibacterium sp.]|nr:SRPBCC family protein [Sterolibacterium sp.]
MAIEMKESFQVAAPVEKVWDFMMNPEMVVACMPGAGLKEVVDPSKFIGTVKLKVGAVTAQYEGTINYAEVDAAARYIKLLAEGNERGGGTATATIACQLVSIDSGTDVQFESSVDLTGKLVQVGRGMIEGVAGQIVKKYIANVRKMLEVEAAPTEAGAQSPSSSPAVATPAPGQAEAAPAVPPQEEAIDMGSIVFKALWMSIVNFFKRLFGRG